MTCLFSVCTTGLEVFIIIVYYFQDSQLFHHVGGYMTSHSHNAISQFIQSLLSSLISLNLDFFGFLTNLCPLIGAQPVQNEVISIWLTILILPSFLLIYSILTLLQKVTRKVIPFLRSSGMRYREMDSNPDGQTLSIWHGVVLLVLLTIQPQSVKIFTLFGCTRLGDSHVLLIDGNIQCFMYWEYLFDLYWMCMLLPIFVILTLAPSSMRNGNMTLKEFAIACLVPVPFLIYLLTKEIKKKMGNQTVRAVYECEPGTLYIVSFLQPQKRPPAGRRLPAEGRSPAEGKSQKDYWKSHGIIFFFRQVP